MSQETKHSLIISSSTTQSKSYQLHDLSKTAHIGRPQSSSSSSSLTQPHLLNRQLHLEFLFNNFQNNAAQISKHNYDDDDDVRPKISKFSQLRVHMKNSLFSMDNLTCKITGLRHNNFKDIEDAKNCTDQIISELKNEKSKIKKQIQTLDKKKIQKLIEKTIRKRRQKRLRKKCEHKELQKLKSIQLNRRKELRESIDKWQKDEQLKDSKAIQAKEETERITQILSGTNKKKLQAIKYLKLFDSLEELRRVRKQKSIGMGIIAKNSTSSTATSAIMTTAPANMDQQFTEKMLKLKLLWNDQLKNYELEENELRRKYFHENQSNSIGDEWTKVFFGNDYLPKKQVDHKNQIMLKSTYNLKEFLRVRHLWDSFIVPNDNALGSSIPPGWVLPNSENNSNNYQWSTYTEQSKDKYSC